MAAADSSNLAEYFQRALTADNDHPVLAFPRKPEGFSDFRYYKIAELKTLVDGAAAWYIANGIKPRRAGERAKRIAVTARGDIDWCVTFFALARMGHTFLVISPRLPDSTQAALAQKANVDALVYGRKPDMLGFQLEIEVPIYRTAQPQECAPTAYEDLLCDPTVVDGQDEAFICHSSGSTGIPKLFSTRHATIPAELKHIRPMFGHTIDDWIASAPYNVAGLRVAVYSVSKENATSFFDNDQAPFTAEGLAEFLAEAKPKSIWVTPYSLELLASTDSGMRSLKEVSAVRMFGAVLPKIIGDRITAAGVHISSFYGLSEGGPLMGSTNRPRNDLDWDYLMADPPSIEKFLWFKPIEVDPSSKSSADEDQLYELVVRDGTAHVLKEVKDEDGNLNTGDVWQKHPTKEGRWRIVGRKDDQIKCYQNDRQVIINGLEYEHKIKNGNEDIIEEAIMFGQGKNRVGVLVFAEEAAGPAHKWVLERIWKTIQTDINAVMKVPIEKDMIKIITGPSDLPRTTKLNFIRPQVYMKYHSVIDAAYAGTEEQVANYPLHAHLHLVKSR